MAYRAISPAFLSYVDRLKAQRLVAEAEFRKRRDEAIAKQAVEEQGIGE